MGTSPKRHIDKFNATPATGTQLQVQKLPISKKSPMFDILEMYKSPIKELFEFDLCDHIVE